MSGTAPEEVNVSISGTATEFTASCAAASSAAQGLTASINSLATSMTAANVSLTAATPAIDSLRTASTASTQALTATNTAASAASRSLLDIVNASTGVSRSMGNASESADVFRRGLGDASNEVKQLRSFFDEGAEGAGRFAHGSSRATAELVVLAHEAIQGRFSRIPGSLMVMGEYMGGLSIATLGWAAAIGVAVYSVYELFQGWQHVEQAVRAAQGAQLTTGTWTQQSQGQIRDAIKATADLAGVSQTTAADIQAQYQAMGGAAAKYRGEISDIGLSLAKLTGADQVETAQQVAKAFNGGAESALHWAKANNFLEGSTASQIEEMIAGGKQTQAMGALLDALSERYGKSGQAAFEAAKQAKAAYASLMEQGINGVPDLGGAGAQMPTPEQTAIGKPGSQAQAPEEVDQSAVVEKNSQALLRQQQIISQIEQAEAAKARGVEGSEEAIANLRQQLAATHTTLEQQQHQQTMAGLQSDLLAARDNAEKRVQITKDIAAETARYEGENSAATMNAQRQVQSAQQAADEQSLRLHLAKIGAEEAAAAGHAGREIAIENEKLAVLTEAGKQGTVEYQNELNRRTSLEKQAGDQATQLQVEKLRGDQEAARGNLAQQEAIQDQIIAIVRAHYGEDTAQLQAELSKQQRLRAEDAQKTATLAVQQLEEKRKLLEEETRSEEQHIAASRQDGDLSISAAKAQQLSLISTYQTASAQILAEEARKAAGIQALAEQVARRQQELAQKTASDIQRANDQAAEESARAWQTSNRQIADTFARDSMSVLSGQKTMTQELIALGDKGVESAIAWAARKALAWIEGEIAQTAATDAQAALRAGADTAASAPTTAMVLARWLGLETAKTTATTAGAAHRATADSGGGYLSEIGTMLSRWLGLETAKSAATTAGASERTATDATAAAAGAASMGATARLAIAAAAAEAAAWAFADSASLGPPGLVAAPGAAAAAEATVMGFQAAVPSLSVGTWGLPSDARIDAHAGETIIPPFESGQFRSAMAALSSAGNTAAGGAGASGGDVHVHFNVSAMDGASVQSFIRANGRQIAQTVAAHASRNPSLRASY